MTVNKVGAMVAMAALVAGASAMDEPISLPSKGSGHAGSRFHPGKHKRRAKNKAARKARKKQRRDA